MIKIIQYKGMYFVLNGTSNNTEGLEDPYGGYDRQHPLLHGLKQALESAMETTVEPTTMKSKTEDFCVSSKAYSYLNVTCSYPIDYALVLHGYIAPFLLLLTVVLNSLILLILSRPHMRSPTNVILTALALCDMLTTLFPAPWNFYMYTLGNHYKPFGPVALCKTWAYMTQAIPQLFHTASIWMTLALAVHQYIYVCHTACARTWCTTRRVVLWLVCIVALATLFALPTFLEQGFSQYIIVWGGHFEEVCKERMPRWMHAVSLNAYYSTRFTVGVLFVHIIPCTSLVVINILLIRAMRAAEENRRKLFKENTKADSQRRQDSNNTTWMIVVILAVYLIAALPAAVVTILHVISVTLTDFLNYRLANKIVLLSNFFVQFFFPINFVIYCTMSRQFRETFKGFFVKRTISDAVASDKTTQATI